MRTVGQEATCSCRMRVYETRESQDSHSTISLLDGDFDFCRGQRRDRQEAFRNARHASRCVVMRFLCKSERDLAPVQQKRAAFYALYVSRQVDVMVFRFTSNLVTVDPCDKARLH